MKSWVQLVAVSGSVLVAVAGACSAGSSNAKGLTGAADGSTGSNGSGTGGNPTSLASTGNGGSITSLGSGGSTGNGGSSGVTVAKCVPNCTDFPTAPVFTTGTPMTAPSSFMGTASGTGPCIIEPQDGSLFPHNWLRPRVNFTSTASLFQITFHTPVEKNDYVIYTTTPTWTMPKTVWTALASAAIGQTVTVTVRASTGSGFTESTSTFSVAPVDAGGSIVFWNATSLTAYTDTSQLYGFSPGDEGVVTTLTPTQVTTQMYQTSGQLESAPTTMSGTASPAGTPDCIGCHTSTPDGKAVSFTGGWPWNVALADVTSGMSGQLPTYVTQGGMMMAQSPWQGVTTFSMADWSTGKYRYITSFAPRVASTDPSMVWEFWNGSANSTGTGADDLIWVDLASTASVPTIKTTTNPGTDITTALVMAQGTLWGIIPRNGEPTCANNTNYPGKCGAVTPNWSHDGTTIAYTYTDSTSDGHVGHGPNSSTTLTKADIYTVPFNDGMGGTVTPVANESGVGQYYPDFSPDDKFIAYNRVATIPAYLYHVPNSELYMTPAGGGGTPTRLAANDPPACTSLSTATIFNSWPKWSPLATKVNGDTYYFFTFSSARQSTTMIPGSGGSQPEAASELFLGSVKVDATGKVTTYPAIYLWNQHNVVTTTTDPTTGKPVSKVTVASGTNLTPAWHDFVIPPVPPVTVVTN